MTPEIGKFYDLKEIRTMFPEGVPFVIKYEGSILENVFIRHSQDQIAQLYIVYPGDLHLESDSIQTPGWRWDYQVQLIDYFENFDNTQCLCETCMRLG